MQDRRVDHSRASIIQGKRARRDKFDLEPVVSRLELTIENGGQGSHGCRRCAAMHGRYSCSPSAGVQHEWLQSDAGLELIVRLLTSREGGARMQAMILVKDGSQSHARAFYSCELSSTEGLDGSWWLKLISERSKCGFVFPGQVQIVSSPTCQGK